jgi:hypothetical protein
VCPSCLQFGGARRERIPYRQVSEGDVSIGSLGVTFFASARMIDPTNFGSWGFLREDAVPQSAEEHHEHHSSALSAALPSFW